MIRASQPEAPLDATGLVLLLLAVFCQLQD